MRTSKEKLSKPPKVRENADDQIVIGFSFTSDWLGSSRGFSEPITEQREAELTQIRHSNENCTISLLDVPTSSKPTKFKAKTNCDLATRVFLSIS